MMNQREVITRNNKLFSWFRKLFKRGNGNGGRRRQRRQSSRQGDDEQVGVPSEEDQLLATNSSDSAMDYEQEVDDDETGSNNSNDNPVTFQPFVVMTLTLVGSIDEISYFPSLILGQVFTPVDIVIGTFIASICMILIVTLVLQPCLPCLEFLDSIPLYAIVAFFALALTTEWLVG